MNEPNENQNERGRITIRAPEHVIELLDLAASMAGLKTNQFVIQAALEKASQVTEDMTRIKLSQQDAEWFFNLLDNPPPPNQALIDTMARGCAHRNQVYEFNETKEIEVKNGKQIHLLTYFINPNRPKCWVEGMEYKFNSFLMRTEVIQDLSRSRT